MSDNNVIDFESMKKRLEELEEYRRKVEAEQEKTARNLHNKRVQEEQAQNDAFEKLLNAYKVTLPDDTNAVSYTHLTQPTNREE